MLHLTIIGIVCAVSALNEGIALNGRKNNGSNIFCQPDEKKQNVGKACLPGVYDVEFTNSSEVASQKIKNMTISLFYDFISRQYKNTRSNSCSVIRNVLPTTKEKFSSGENLKYRKRSLLWSGLTPKTLRPQEEYENCKKHQTQKCENRILKKCRIIMAKLAAAKKLKPEKTESRCDLSSNEKKMLFRIKSSKYKFGNRKLHKRGLNRVVNDNGLDSNKEIQNLVQKIFLENQRRQGISKKNFGVTTLKINELHQNSDSERGKNFQETNKKIFPVFNRVKAKLKFSHSNIRNIKDNKSNPAQSRQYEDPKTKILTFVSSSYNVPESIKKIIGRNYFESYKTNPMRNYMKNLVARPYPYSKNFKPKMSVLQTNQNFISRNKRKRKQPRLRFRSNKRKHWSFSKKFETDTQHIYDSRLKRHDKRTITDKPHEKLIKVINNNTIKSEFFYSGLSLSASNTEAGIIEEIQGNERNEKTNWFSYTSREGTTSKQEERVTKNHGDEENHIPEQTLERPFLKETASGKETQNRIKNSAFNEYDSLYNPMTDSPSFSSSQPYRTYKNKICNYKYLSPYRYLKIRHVLRNYLIHNKIWNPVKIQIRFSKRRKKCCGCKSCPSTPYKCWRSTPLLCIPYIKKGQDDVLKYLIRVMQNMLGKPFPPKVDIFEKTKYKPWEKKESEQSCEELFDEEPRKNNSTPYLTCCINPLKYPSFENANTTFITCPTIPFIISPSPCPTFPFIRGLPSCPMFPFETTTLPCPAVPCPTTQTTPSTTPCPPTPTPYFTDPCPTTLNPCPQKCSSAPTLCNPPTTQKLDSIPTRPWACPTSDSWPTGFPFFIPRIEQILGHPLNEYSCDDRFTPLPTFYTFPNQIWVPSYRHSPIIPAAPLVQVPYTSVSLPPPGGQYSYSTRATISDTSYSSKTDIWDTNYSILPVTFQKVTPAVPPAKESKATVTPVEPFHTSTMSFYAFPVPGLEEDYFSYTTTPTVSCEFSDTSSQQTLSPRPTVSASSPSLSSQMISEETSPNLQLESPMAFLNPYPVKEEIKNYREKEEPFCDYHVNIKHFKKNVKNRKLALDKSSMKKAMQYDDYPLDVHPTHDQEINHGNLQRLFKMKHFNRARKQRYKSQKKEDFPAYDYHLDNYPPLKFNPYSNVQSFRKKNAKRTNLLSSFIRRKRENDNDYWPEKIESYNDYMDEFSYNDENQRTYQRVLADENHNWTAPSYDMFSELARAMSGSTKNNLTIEVTTSDDSKRNLAGSSSQSSIQVKSTISSASNAIFQNFTYTTTSPFARNLSEKANNGYKLTSPHPIHSTNYSFTGKKTIPSINETNRFFNSTENTNLTSTITAAAPSVRTPPPTFSNKSLINTQNTSPASALNKTTHNPTYSTSPSPTKNVFFSVPNSTSATISTNTASVTTPVSAATKSNSNQDIDSKKSGKSSFITSNAKTLQKALESNTGREDTEIIGEQNFDSIEKGQIPTTLKSAIIVKGPKKLLTKPSPKVYSRVYPDSLTFETDMSESVTPTTARTAKTSVMNPTPLSLSTSKPDIRLQLLAVCEGYLEVVKLIKAQNQTIGEDLDADLARYCENIISQSFNYQSEKPKKPEINESQTSKGAENLFKSTNSKSISRSGSETVTELSESQLWDKIIEDILNNPIYKRELSEKYKNKGANDKTIENADSADTKAPELIDDPKLEIKNDRKKDCEASSEQCEGQTEEFEKEENNEDLIKMGMTEEQVELIDILRKRKRALLSWLFNSKDQGKSDDVRETEYFEDEDLIAAEPDVSEYSGTIKPKGDEKSIGTEKKNLSFGNESVFPVYAKQYGYDKGGELREVEVLWRKVNEKTHEEKIFKNLSVLALLLTSTNSPDADREDPKLVGNRGFENEEMSEIQLKSDNKISLAVGLSPVSDYTSSTTLKPEKTDDSGKVASNIQPTSDRNAIEQTKSIKGFPTNATYTFVNKPDPSLIVGAPPNITKTHPNTTHKPSHKYGVAKDLFQEYTIEFLNYAVYILPIMFTILFLFCCTCCALHILKIKKSIERQRKKKKTLVITDESSETTDESARERKRRKREAKRKKKSKGDKDENFEKKRSKKFWNVLKLPSKTSREFNEENNQTEKKKSFLRFLKSRKDTDKTEISSSPVHELDEYSKEYVDSGEEGKTNESDSQNGKKKQKRDDEYSEAAERRELIALLEELKKIETEHSGEKKEVKSVHVQYAMQDDENSGFRHPDFSHPYQKNAFGIPRGCSFYSKQFPSRTVEPGAVEDFERYEDVNELTELLPCECSYYSKRNDFLRQCDFKIDGKDRCERFLKIFRDSSVIQKTPFAGKNFRRNENENRSYFFNKYKNIKTDPKNEELMRLTHKNAGPEVKYTENSFSFKKSEDLMEEMENFKRQLKKKNIRLKDDGVLCRL